MIITTNLLYAILIMVLYVVLDILVPAIALYPFVKKKRLGFRILFYQIAWLAYVAFLSYFLAYTKLYCAFSMWIGGVGVPVGFRLWYSRKEIRVWWHKQKVSRDERNTLEEGIGMLRRRADEGLSKNFSSFLNKYLKPNLIEIAVFALILFIVGRSLGLCHLTNYTYACSDEPTHVHWVNCLIHNEAFPVGLYPHGMHFVVGQMCSMFGLNVARSLLSFGITSLMVIFMSAYNLCCRVFKNRFVGLAGLVLFLCSTLYRTSSFFDRLIMVMPMEFAMYAFFVMLYGLVSWIKDKDNISLAMVGLGILGTMMIHFFVTVYAFFAVAVFGIIYLRQLLKHHCLVKAIMCGVLALVLAVLPYAVGFACGYQLEQSFTWGMSNVTTDVEDVLESDLESGDVNTSSLSAGVNAVGTTETDAFSAKPEETVQLPLTERVKNFVTEEIDTIGSYVSMYITNNSTTGLLMLGCAILPLLIGVVGLIVCRKDEERKERYRSYIFISLSFFAGMIVLYFGCLKGYISIMLPLRTAEFIALNSIILLGSPALLLFEIFDGKKLEWVDVIVTTVGLGLSVLLCVLGGANADHILMYAMTMEATDIKAEEYLVNHHEDYTWTYISTTNARMAVYKSGYHYEITDLLRCVRDTKELYIPTEDIYVAVEKVVPQLNDKLIDGSNFDNNSFAVSAEYADILLSDVMPIIGGSVDSEVYLREYSRRVIMSHLYYWMEKVKQVYPNEVTVFMEDDYVTIYHIRQDPYFLLNLVLDYSDLVEKELDY